MPLARSTLLAFLVGAAMLGSLSPRASADLPFVDSIRFLPKPVNGPPEERPICPGDSIVMLVTGHFPSDCYEFLGITPVVFVREAPPTFQIVVNRDTCTRPCIANVIIPWRASVTLPPLPVPAHLPIDVWLSEWICREPLPPDTALQAHLFFLVDSCGGPPPPPPGCLRASMHEGPPDHCDATIAKNQPAQVTLRVGGVNVALAGLQGFAPRERRAQDQRPRTGRHGRRDADSLGAECSGRRFRDVRRARRADPAHPARHLGLRRHSGAARHSRAERASSVRSRARHAAERVWIGCRRQSGSRVSGTPAARCHLGAYLLRNATATSTATARSTCATWC